MVVVDKVVDMSSPECDNGLHHQYRLLEMAVDIPLSVLDPAWLVRACGAPCPRQPGVLNLESPLQPAPPRAKAEPPGQCSLRGNPIRASTVPLTKLRAAIAMR